MAVGASGWGGGAADGLFRGSGLSLAARAIVSGARQKSGIKSETDKGSGLNHFYSPITSSRKAKESPEAVREPFFAV